MKHRTCVILTAVAMALSLIGSAAVAGTGTSQQPEAAPQVAFHIGEITVTGTPRDLPGSVDILSQDQIETSDAGQALDLMRRVPGVTIMNYSFGGVPNGFTLRGWYLPHGRGAAATVDGIPANCYMENGDGSIDLNAVIVDDLESVEVIKGPMDKQYGNWARAGVINFNTRKRGDFIRAKASAGSDDTRKYYASFGKESESGRFNQIYSGEYYTTDGFRNNSGYERKNAYGKWFFRPSNDVQLGLVVHGFDSDWDSAGYISQSVWESDPKADNTKNDGGDKKLGEVQVHLDWQIRPDMDLTVRTWLADDDYSRFWTVPVGAQPQQEYHYEQTSYGAAANLGMDVAFGGQGRIRLDAGTDYKVYDTLDQRYRTDHRRRTGMVHDDDYHFKNLGAYAKVNVDPLPSLRLFGGLRLDSFDGRLDHQLTGEDRRLRDYDIWTYSAGVIWAVHDAVSLYANHGTSFQLPIGAAAYNADAPDASELDYYEVGFKARPASWLRLRYAYFQSKNSDEITQLPTSTYVHEGETKRRGHEIELGLMPMENLELFAAYTLQEATYEAGANQGKDIRFIPDAIFMAWAEYQAPTDTLFRVAYRRVGDWDLTPDNRYSADGFQVTDLSVRQALSGGWALQASANNLFDEKYSEFALNLGGTNYYAGNSGRNFMLTLSCAL